MDVPLGSSQSKIVSDQTDIKGSLSALDGDDEAMENKREVDQNIAQELKQQEDSYTEQIASLDINNSQAVPHD